MGCRIGGAESKETIKVQHIKMRFGRILQLYKSPTFANRLLHLQIQDCEL